MNQCTEDPAPSVLLTNNYSALFGVAVRPDGKIETIGVGSLDAQMVDQLAKSLVLLAARMRNGVRKLQAMADK